MQVEVLDEYGYKYALLGTSLSRNQPVENMPKVCERLSSLNGGHNKNLEFIAVWIDITAPRYFWQQLATYRVGNSWLSESTMYTITKHELAQDDFENPIDENILNLLNDMIRKGDFKEIKNNLPEGFLQRRIMVTNYKALRNIIEQRKNHKLEQWHYFCNSILNQVEHPELLTNKQGEL